MKKLFKLIGLHFSKKQWQEARQRLKELHIDSDFIFCQVMEIEQICLKLVRILLELNITKIKYHATQKSKKQGYFSKGVRFDAYIEGDDNAIIIEMQVCNYRDLPLRARYYQSVPPKQICRY